MNESFLSILDMLWAECINEFTIIIFRIHKGRRVLSQEQALEIKQRVDNGEQKIIIAKDFGISRETLYQYLRKISKETG